MSSSQEEYKDMFLAEALENYEELNNLLTALEKIPDDQKAIDALFRITHTLKGNALGMGFTGIAEISHVMEDLFGAVKNKQIKLDLDLVNSLFKANDKLGELIEGVKNDTKVSYKGIRTKLSVILKKATEEGSPESAEDSAPSEAPIVATPTETVSQPAEQMPESAQEVVAGPPSKNEPVEEADDDDEKNEEKETKIAFSDQVQVPVKKLDNLLNLVGELIIERDSLISKFSDNGFNSNVFARLNRIASDLQYGVMDVRLVQIGFLFKKFHRIVRDAATIENKKVDLILEGTEIEIDRNILKIISDSMVHLVRNAVGHGIEKPAKRLESGKSEIGKVTLRARNEKDIVIVDVIDDGAGINADVIRRKAVEKGIITQEYALRATEQEILLCIFEPGFSNAEQINEISGRGVGMDVVKRATESIGGKITIETEVGKGSVMSLHLPSSMALKGALLFMLNNQEYAVALTYTEAVLSIYKRDIHAVANGLMTTYLDKTISILFLQDLFDLNTLDGFKNQASLQKTYNELDENERLEVLVISYNNWYVGIVVDKLLQQKEIVEKTLSKPLDNVDLFSGATVLGNGNVCLVLDVANITNRIFGKNIK